MIHLEIKSQRHNDPEPIGKAPSTEQLIFDEAIVLESGTAEGRSSIVFTLMDERGKRYAAQLTSRLIDSLNGFIKGFDQRCSEHPVENIWKQESKNKTRTR